MNRPEGTFISADEPLRSILPHRAGDRNLLLVGGEGHRASDTVDAGERYRRLEAWARERFPVASLEYRWSTQDAIPIDGVPYIGRMSPVLPARIRRNRLSEVGAHQRHRRRDDPGR